MDADDWRKILTAKQFGNSSNELYTAIFEVNKKLCTANKSAQFLEAFLACSLIQFNKNSGLHPIG